jgi:hypothetical protein
MAEESQRSPQESEATEQGGDQRSFISRGWMIFFIIVIILFVSFFFWHAGLRAAYQNKLEAIREQGEPVTPDELTAWARERTEHDAKKVYQPIFSRMSGFPDPPDEMPFIGMGPGLELNERPTEEKAALVRQFVTERAEVIEALRNARVEPPAYWVEDYERYFEAPRYLVWVEPMGLGRLNSSLPAMR